MATSTITYERPAVDDRLVMPECGYEIIDGELVAVSPAHEPHGSCHARLAALLAAHVADGFAVAVDMLTRTSTTSDFAPDASVYPLARDATTGGRQLEQLAFEIVSTESLAHAGRKASRLVSRGVRRVFAIDVERARTLEWSHALDRWEPLTKGAAIVDPTLAVALRVDELAAVSRADDAVARALLEKHNSVLLGAIEAARAAALVAVIRGRGFVLTDAEREEILTMRDPATLDRWLAAVATCPTVAALLALRYSSP